VEWHDQPALPAPLTPVEPVPGAPPEPAGPQAKGPGVKRTLLTAALTGLLLVGGVVAVVSAASPDPGASSAPSATEPSTDGTTTPTTRPQRGTGAGPADCPAKDTDGSSGSSGGSDGSSGSDVPATDSPAATPLT
jgi:hypothetical protein